MMHNAQADRADGARAVKALSIRQPWAWLIVNNFSNVECRNRRFNFRGPVLIHASKRVDRAGYHSLVELQTPPPRLSGSEAISWRDLQQNIPPVEELETEGIVGRAVVADCVYTRVAPRFRETFGLVLTEARPLRFQPCRGKLGLFEPELPPSATPSIADVSSLIRHASPPGCHDAADGTVSRQRITTDAIASYYHLG
jgi:hypothetical protein